MPRNHCSCQFCTDLTHQEALEENELREAGADPEDLELMPCEVCDVEFSPGGLTTLEGMYYCGECYSEVHVECCCCSGDMHRDGEYVHWCDSEEGYLCEDCYYNYYSRCRGCEEVFREENMTGTEDGAYCTPCASEYLSACGLCDLHTETDNLYSLDDEREARAEQGFDEDDLEYWYEDEYDDLCLDCARQRGWVTAGSSPEQEVIRDYYYKPSIQVRIDEKGRLLATHNLAHALHRQRLFGLELEVERGPDGTGQVMTAKKVIEMGGGLLYCKRDSSIGDGFEIVSHPGVDSFWLKGVGRETFTEVLAYLRSQGYHSEKGGRCGFHIHTNRDLLTRLHKYNLVRFLHDPRLRMFLFGLSRRSEGQLSSYSVITLPETSKGMDADLEEYAKRIARGGQNSGRSTILNFQGPTAELRLFRGTLNDVKFWGDFQFYNSVLNYTDPKQGNLGLRERPTWASFRQYVESYPLPHEVAELRTHLKELGI